MGTGERGRRLAPGETRRENNERLQQCSRHRCIRVLPIAAGVSPGLTVVVMVLVLRAAWFVRLLVRSRARRGQKSDQVRCLRHAESLDSGFLSPAKQKRRSRYRRPKKKKKTDFPSAASCNDDESGQQTALLRRAELHKFHSRPLLRWSAAKKVWGWAAGFKNHESPLSQRWDPCFGCAVPWPASVQAPLCPKKGSHFYLLAGAKSSQEQGSATKPRDWIFSPRSHESRLGRGGK